MKHMKKQAFGVSLLALTVGAGQAWAQSTTDQQAQIDALNARIEALERGKAAKPEGGDFVLGETTFDVYGYVKADFFYDFDFDQGDTAFVNNIGEPANATDGTFGATARQTRIGLRTSTPTDIGDVQGQIELDLFGGDSSTGELRIRHANIRIGDAWLIGQFWSNFQPLSHYPTSVEFNGPVGISFARVPQIRYSGSAGANVNYSLSIEENIASSDDPTVTAALEYNGDLFEARIAGLVGTTTADGADVDQTGITLSGAVRPWAGGLFQVTYTDGEALGPYLIGDGAASVNGQENDVEGYTIELRQDIGERWNVGIAYGNEEYDLPTSTGDLSFTELETVHVNAFYKATDNLTLSAEYIFGERNDTITGNTFNGDRVQFAAQLNF